MVLDCGSNHHWSLLALIGFALVPTDFFETNLDGTARRSNRQSKRVLELLLVCSNRSLPDNGAKSEWGDSNQWEKVEKTFVNPDISHLASLGRFHVINTLL